jgi:hypothetical protein
MTKMELGWLPDFITYKAEYEDEAEGALRAVIEALQQMPQKELVVALARGRTGNWSARTYDDEVLHVTVITLSDNGGQIWKDAKGMDFQVRIELFYIGSRYLLVRNSVSRVLQ